MLDHLGVFGDATAAPPGESGRREVLGVQPTGAGKSVCFQAAAIAFEGTTLVVSPLLSLMFDQVASLSASGLRTATLNSMQSSAQRAEVMTALGAGELDLLYTSPEQLTMNRGLVEALRALPVPLLAVDEAHCISSWGHDFRPSYRRILSLLDALRIPRLVALTASAPPKVRDDIASQLGMGSDHLRLVASCRRDNIALSRGEKSLDSLVRLLSAGAAAGAAASVAAGPALVYAQTRKEVDAVADELEAAAADGSGAGAVLRYHAGMSSAARAEAQEAFFEGDDATVMVATNAFGMGIDKPNIRTVVHYGPPGTIEQLYQEVGRGGRDGLPTRAVLLLSEKAGTDLAIHRFFLDAEHPTAEDVLRVWRAMPSIGADIADGVAADGAGGGAAAGVDIEWPAAAADLGLECSVTELQEAAGKVTTEGGSRRKVQATSRCVGALAEWGYLQRKPSRTSVSLFDDAGGSLRGRAAGRGGPDGPSAGEGEGGGRHGGFAEGALPSGVRANTMQARAWRVLSRHVGLEAALESQGMVRGEDAAQPSEVTAAEAGTELVRRVVETDAYDGWVQASGLDATQFANAVRGLQAKGLVGVQRSPALQVIVPAEMRETALPGKADPRLVALVEKRQRAVDKLKAVAEYMARRPGKSAEEDNERLWRFIMRYFGEAP